MGVILFVRSGGEIGIMAAAPNRPDELRRADCAAASAVRARLAAALGGATLLLTSP
jgi:hypothetical protein